MEPSGKETRGRQAESPVEINRYGWRDILLRTKNQFIKDDVTLVAAGVAFYFFLSIPPALAALISVYGLIADPATVQEHIAGMKFLPADVLSLLNEQMVQQAARPEKALSLTLAGTVMLALWSASKGMKALIRALNIAYNEEEDRGFIKINSLNLFFTAALILVFLISAFSLVVVPALLKFATQYLSGLEYLAAAASWGVLIGAVLAFLAALYRWGPDRTAPMWRWLSPGALVAALIWLGASGIFTFYVSNFGKYGETYGSLAGVVVFLLWLWISIVVVLLGAELNAEMEHQTKFDTTAGTAKPLGERGAFVADNLGEKP